MSMNPTGLVIDNLGGAGIFTVIDDGPDSAQVLVIPGSFYHRRLVPRGEVPSLGEYHPARVPPPAEDDDLARIEIAFEALRTLEGRSLGAAITYLRRRLIQDAAGR